MANIKPWIKAFRLRTLPLSFSSILSASAMAMFTNNFNGAILFFTLCTTLFLQILSNLANDYGDAKSGVDNENRIGPERAIQSGEISLSAMKKALYLFAILSFVFGTILLFIAFPLQYIVYILGFLALGLLAIWAAIQYTAGKNAYGYKGLGDVFVFLFFGLVGVCGTYFLYAQQLPNLVLFTAIIIGLLSVAVLNLNNMRDRVNDAQFGKNTIAVRLGFKASKMYHIILVYGALVLTLVFNHLYFDGPQLFLIPIVFWLIHLFTIIKVKNEKDFDPELKKVAISAFIFSLLLLVDILKN
ncbi:MAG: 1,4-dihydroxy-2-naphthoate octaprenyltransferase [Bacteroidota bacterium]|jgi:1,4-dihydroxy-2-naphthoate octaprenyltransferase